ncbi:MAG: AMP-binding protein [Burkholderiales bacterium]|nr:AMP-binding protein [Burkholderiales bacterium]
MRAALSRQDLHPFSGLDVAWLVEERAHSRRDHPFIVWEPFVGAGCTITYGAFHQRIRRIAGGLVRRGVAPGDRVLIHLENCPEALLAWYACAWIGAVAVTTNARASDDELSYYADHCGAVGGITQPKFAERVAASCRGLGWLAVTADDGGEPAARAPDAASRFDALDGEPPPRRAPDPLHPCSVQYTSGTTSRPKAVLWTHANALWGARVNAAHEDLRADDVHLAYLPLFHTNAQAYSVLACLWVGATCVIQPRFSASRFWPVSLAHRCTWTSLIPFCVKALLPLDVPPAHHYRWWGSAVSAPPTDAHFNVRTMGWWGMTETITHGIVGSHCLPNVPLSIGRPAPEYEIAIVESAGAPVREARHVEPGGSGHLFIRGVRGLSLFKEYLGNERATREAFDADGWFRTGDRVNLLDDGSIQFGDRDKDMLKVGGENVAASEVERVILAVAGVHECAVVAKKHAMLDEVPVAFVLPAADAPPDLARRVAAACAAQLADFKQPAEVRLVDSLPRSTLEKIAKAELRRRLQEDAGAG